ncbi:MAG: HAMP domain-containing sensor histidine kinase [Oscillospiraceae bacterium]|nr:HAMP domain-containing histidine kinase [Oscillospiraceae bacterium]MDY3065872.1 HAMP domain-containing sensor histidine kinase [Oscillospiraceae bacterium]
MDSVLGILDAQVHQENDRPVSLMTQISDRYRTPVSNILNMLSALSTALRDESYNRERAYLNAAARECYAILRGVVPSHDYYLLVNKKMPYEPTTLLLGDFLEDLYITLRPFFRKRGQKLVLSRCQTPLPVSIDPRLFSLALFHLISNAANFSPLDSTITISLLESSRYCTVTVIDEGDGIAAEDLLRVFEPFYVSPDTRLPESQIGSGLGLPIVQEIVKLHGGDIFLTSEQNHGTSAAVRLPFSENPSANLVHADTSKYVTDKFSDLYILFAELCEINLFYPS